MAEGVVQHSLQEEISLFFSRRRRWASLVFESVCICENLPARACQPHFVWLGNKPIDRVEFGNE
jgi:hypothetical protein